MQTVASLPTLRRPFSMAGLGRNRLVLGAAMLGAITIIAAWQWSSLIALGVAPLLLSVAPCAAMCALGLCMHRMGNSSCSLASAEPPPVPYDPDRIENPSDQTTNR